MSSDDSQRLRRNTMQIRQWWRLGRAARRARHRGTMNPQTRRMLPDSAINPVESERARRQALQLAVDLAAVAFENGGSAAEADRIFGLTVDAAGIDGTFIIWRLD